MGEQYKQPQTFRSEPTEIRIGLKGKIVKIEDLPYGKHKELMRYLFDLWYAEQTAPITARMFAGLLRKRLVDGKAEAKDGEVLQQGTIAEAVKSIGDDLFSVYSRANSDQVADLLILCSGEQITKQDIETDMGADECRALLVWLLDRNTVSRKNLMASLSSILNPQETSTLK